MAKYFVESLDDGSFGICTVAADGITDVLADFPSRGSAVDTLKQWQADEIAERTEERMYRSQYDYACGYLD